MSERVGEWVELECGAFPSHRAFARWVRGDSEKFHSVTVGCGSFRECASIVLVWWLWIVFMDIARVCWVADSSRQMSMCVCVCAWIYIRLRCALFDNLSVWVELREAAEHYSWTWFTLRDAYTLTSMKTSPPLSWESGTERSRRTMRWLELQTQGSYILPGSLILGTRLNAVWQFAKADATNKQRHCVRESGRSVHSDCCSGFASPRHIRFGRHVMVIQFKLKTRVNIEVFKKK